VSHEITVEMGMQDAVKTLYEEGGLLIQRQVTGHPLLGAALKGGSRTKGRAGSGIPEAAVFGDPSCKNILAPVACAVKHKLAWWPLYA
jgi:hypothetical protein